MRSRGWEAGSNPHSGQARSSTQVQFLSSGAIVGGSGTVMADIVAVRRHRSAGIFLPEVTSRRLGGVVERFPELRVAAATGDQLVVRPVLHQLALFDDDDAIGVASRLEP